MKEKLGPNESHLYQTQPGRQGHRLNFLECVRTRTETIAPIEIAHRSITVAHLGNIALLLGRKLRWDPEKEEILGDPVASRMLSRAYRGSWTV